jgi:hypothetical protein
MSEKSLTDCSMPNNRDETQRLRRSALALSISAVKVRIEVALGLSLCLRSSTRWAALRPAWNWFIATDSGSDLRDCQPVHKSTAALFLTH